MRDSIGPLSKRTWGLDTFAGMFFPIPAEVSEAHVKMTLPWKDPERDEEKTQREIRQFMRPDGNLAFPVVLKTNNRAAIYITKLTPAALLQVKGITALWDVDFAPSQAVLGEVTLGTFQSGGSRSKAPAFRARTSAQVTQSDVERLSLPHGLIGKSPYFWWIMFSDNALFLSAPVALVDRDDARQSLSPRPHHRRPQLVHPSPGGLVAA